MAQDKNNPSKLPYKKTNCLNPSSLVWRVVELQKALLALEGYL